jgi:hypothetical protein
MLSSLTDLEYVLGQDAEANVGNDAESTVQSFWREIVSFFSTFTCR